MAIDTSQSQINLAIEVFCLYPFQYCIFTQTFFKNFGANENLTFLRADAACAAQLLPENSTDLVAAGMAVHWFDQSKFFQESWKVCTKLKDFKVFYIIFEYLKVTVV